MLIPTGKKARLSVHKGSEIEFSVDGFMCGDGNTWYCGILERDLAKSEKTVISVRYLDPLFKQNSWPPISITTVQRLIRPVPPPDPFPDVGFEVGDVIDAVHDGGWWPGLVIKVLRNQRYLVYLDEKPGAIEIERKYLRPRMIWHRDEWFRCEKRELVKEDISNGTSVEVRTEVDELGDVWSKATFIKENEDGTLLVKLLTFDTEISLPYSKTRPSPPYSYRSETFNLMDKVDALVEYLYWCPGVVSKLPDVDRHDYQYVVDLGPKKESKKFTRHQLRPSLEWKDGVWVKEQKLPEGTTMEELLSKRERGRKPKQKIGVASNGSKAASIKLANMTDDNKHLASSEPQQETETGMPNSFVETVSRIVSSIKEAQRRELEGVEKIIENENKRRKALEKITEIENENRELQRVIADQKEVLKKVDQEFKAIINAPW